MPQNSILFDCGPVGHVLAADGITFRPVNLPVEIGSLVIAEAAQGEITVDKVDLDNHIVTLGVKKTDHPNPKLAKLAIRAPIGVRIFKVITGGTAGLYHETGPGYNTLPKYIGPDEDAAHGQTVQELVLITGHVPPRRDPAKLRADDFGQLTELRQDEVNARQKQNG